MTPDIQEEFARCSKIHWRLLQAVLTSADDDEFRVVMETHRPLMLEKQPVNGVVVQSNIADKFYTAVVTQEGLLNLIRNDRVKRIEGGRQMRPC